MSERKRKSVPQVTHSSDGGKRSKAVTRHSSRRGKPQLGDKTDEMWEWVPVKAMKAARKHLRKQVLAVEAEMRELCTPAAPTPSAGGRPAGDGYNTDGDLRSQKVQQQQQQSCEQTHKRKLLTDKLESATHRLESLDMLDEYLGPNEYDATRLRLSATGAPDPNGRHQLPFRGLVRGVCVEYGRFPHVTTGGRRYPRNIDTILKPKDPTAAYDGGGANCRRVAPVHQGMPRNLRSWLFAYLHDLDCVACHPSILYSLAQNYEVSTPNLAAYIKDTRGWRRGVAEWHNLGDDEAGIEAAKTLLTAIIYGASYAKRCEEWQVAVPMKFVEQLVKELDALRAVVMASDRYKPFVDRTMAYQRTKESKFRVGAHGKPLIKDEEEATRGCWSELVQSIEDVCLKSMQKTLAREGRLVMALTFDGLVVLHHTDDTPESMVKLMQKLSKGIKRATGVDMAVHEKEGMFSPKQMATYA